MASKNARTKLMITGALVLVLSSAGVALGQLSGPSPTRVTGAAADDYPRGEACASGIAINATLSHVCSNECTTDSDCSLTGWGCRQVPQGNGERVGLCFPHRVLAHP